MHWWLGRVHSIPSCECAYLITYTGSNRPAISTHLNPEMYHIRHMPFSRKMHGVTAMCGSSAFRSIMGPSNIRVNVSPPSSLTAKPIEFLYGTVTPRFHPL